MKKMFKRIFALICILTLATGVSPASAASWKPINIDIYTDYLHIGPFTPKGDIHLQLQFTGTTVYNTGIVQVIAINENGAPQPVYSQELYFHLLDNYESINQTISYAAFRSKDVIVRMAFGEPVIIRGNIIYYGD